MNHKVVLSFLLSLIIVGCGGSGENGSDPFGDNGNDPTTAGATAITVATFASDCSTSQASFVAGETICVEAELSGTSGTISNEIVSFNVGLGTLSIDSRLTNSQGIAQVMITSDSTQIGASSVVATSDSLTSSGNYEFLSAGVGQVFAPDLELSLLLNGQATNTFNTDQQVSVQGRIFDRNRQPLENQIVQFSTVLGTLSPTSALTNADGIAQTLLSASDTDLGASSITAQFDLDGVTITNALNYQILAADTVTDDTIQIGYFENGTFVPNVLGVNGIGANDEVVISAGATLGLSVALVGSQGNRIATPTQVSFTSNCVQSNLATIDQSVSTINGEALSTFEDLSCAGADGNTDQIVATVVSNNQTLTLIRDISLQPEDIGSISFISAEPENIVLAGTGGVNNASISTLTFQVNGALGNALSQQEVSFSLNSDVGNLSISPTSGLTNSQGQVSTRVTAGNVPTAVRVTAQTTNTDGDTITTQSDLLTVNTGLPDQNSFSISASDLNPEAFDIDGVTSTITARLGDAFNNPVPDGTAVSFTTEGGSIEPSCITSNGSCSVTWTSGAPRSGSHRITILATAIGHETLFDSNGNNQFDLEDGGAITDGFDSGLRSSFASTNVSGFLDYSEAWRDDNENGVRDTAEVFIDINNNGNFDEEDGLFNGPQCDPAAACGEGVASTTNVRRAIVLVTSSSNAFIDVEDEDGDRIFSNHLTTNSPNISLDVGESFVFNARISDTAGQPVASGSTFAVTSTQGSISGALAGTQATTNVEGTTDLSFIGSNNRTDLGTDNIVETVTISVTSPNGTLSSLSFTYTLAAP